MTESDNQTFLTSIPDDKELQTIIINDDEDDIDIDVKSSADSGETLLGNDEVTEILTKNESQEIPTILIPNTTNDPLQDKMSHDDPSPSAVGEHLQTIIPQSVYDYAAIVYENLESPRQTKLDHDVSVILGSSDPPPGFGFLHPRFYYLEQKRPGPMEPLRVWRGYNGHVYFSPIQVQQLDSERILSSTKSRKSASVRTVIPSARIPNQSRTIVSAYTNKKFSANKTQIHNENSLLSRKVYPPSICNGNGLRNNTLATFVESEENIDEPGQMWRSVVTCIPVQIKPISKRTQHAIEDLQILQQEKSVQDPNGYNRQVLPNIRPIPKAKFVYKGLAYKEAKKKPGINNENDDKNSAGSLKKPLIEYNLAQAYVRYEVNAERTKQTLRKTPFSPTTTPASTAKHESFTKSQTSLDIREIRKRIVKGTTLPYRPTPQSASRTTGRLDDKSALASENPYLRPSTSKSSIPLRQRTVIEMPILTKYVNRSRSITHQTPTSEILASTS